MADNSDNPQQDSEIKEQILSANSEWITHPVTVLIIDLIKKHREKFIQKLAADASSPESKDIALRISAVNIKNTDAILSIIRNPQI